MRRSISRTAALALCVTVALGAAAAPCAASDPPPPRQAAEAHPPVPREPPGARDARPPAAARGQRSEPSRPTPSAPSSFFKSTRGKVTLALMGAGVGFTLWSIQHDRKPVKSPIR